MGHKMTTVGPPITDTANNGHLYTVDTIYFVLPNSRQPLNFERLMLVPIYNTTRFLDFVFEGCS